MRKTIFFALLATSVATQAQLSTYKLSDYLNPDYHYQSFDFGFDANNSYNPINSTNNGTESKQTQSTFYGNLNGLYTGYRNSKNYQGEITGSFSINGRNNYNKRDDIFVYNNITKTTYKSFNSNFSFLSTNRFYGNNKLFLELTPSASVNTMWNKEINEMKTRSDSSNFTRTLDSQVGLSALVGKGRIEQVQDARLALYILDELKANGLLSREPSNEEFLALAAEITKIKNTRFFDSRTHKVADLKALDAYLQSKGLITKESIDYFNILNDNWDFAAGPIRSSGYRLSTGFQANYSHEKNTMNSITNTTQVSYLVRYEYENPVSRYLQNSLYAQAKAGLEWNKTKWEGGGSEHNVNTSPRISATVGYTLGYYPNSRTYIKGTVSQDYDYLFTKNETSLQNVKNEQHKITSNLGIDAYYYFSPQLRLKASFNLQYNYEKYDETYNQFFEPYHYKGNSFNESFNLGLTYSLF